MGGEGRHKQGAHVFEPAEIVAMMLVLGWLLMIATAIRIWRNRRRG